MTKQKSTKKTLLTSVLSLVLCMALLIGATFAWFTDNVTSANNKIVAGNLDVQLLMHDGNDYVDISDSEDPIFGSNTVATNSTNTLWEPGKTQIAYLAIKNNGSLALRYSVALDVENVSKNLYEVMKYAITSDAQYDAKPAWTGGNAVVVGTQAVSNGVSLGAGETRYFALSIHMDEEAGNQYQGGEVNFDLTIVATQDTVEADSFDNQYDKEAKLVTSPAEAQDALDNAVDGTTIQLAAGVNYGTLYIRQNASSRVVDITDAGGDAPGNEKYRSINDLTIIGNGATIDKIAFQVGWIANSGASYVDIKNLTVKGVTFSGTTTPIHLDGSLGSSLGIDGLNIVDCKMKDADGKDRLVFQQITGYKDLYDKTTGEFVMTKGVKNLTITGCEVVGAYMVTETRAMENITITNNTFKNIKARDMLITSDTTNYPGVTYTGAITIMNNTSVQGEERFVRMSGSGNATVVIADNTIIDYKGKDGDYIKATEGNNITIKDNLFIVTTGEALATVIKNASKTAKSEIYLTNATYNGDIKITLADIGEQKGEFVFKALEGTKPVLTGTVTLGYRNQGVGATMWNSDVTFEGITFDHAETEKHSIEVQDVKSLKLVKCTIIGDGEYGIGSASGNGTGPSTITDCVFKNASMQLLGNFATGLVIDNCKFNNSRINVQGGNSVTVQNCVFDATLTDANVGDSFYLVRSNAIPIIVKGCEVSIDSTLTDVAENQAKWALFWNRKDKDWTIQDTAVTLTAAAQAQTGLKVTRTDSTGVMNISNLTVNGVQQ